jgi:hypothetical protein
MNNYALRFSAVLVATLVLSACAMISHEHELDQLDKTQFAYEKAIRWSNFEVANGFRRADDGDRAVPDYARLRHIKVTSYDVLSSTTSYEELKAVQTVEIKYYHADYLREKTLVDRQDWTYDRAQKRWYIQGRLPEFN